MPSNLVNETECAKQLGVSVATLRVWRCNKRYSLSYVKVGRCVRYRPTDIERFLDSRTISGGGAE